MRESVSRRLPWINPVVMVDGDARGRRKNCGLHEVRNSSCSLVTKKVSQPTPLHHRPMVMPLLRAATAKRLGTPSVSREAAHRTPRRTKIFVLPGG